MPQTLDAFLVQQKEEKQDLVQRGKIVIRKRRNKSFRYLLYWDSEKKQARYKYLGKA